METLLEVKNLNIFFDQEKSKTHVVKDLNFKLASGQTMGLVGESGSGKSVTSLAILGLLETSPSNITGQIIYNGKDLLTSSKEELRRLRGSQISMIFQEPMTSLNPVLTVGCQISEALRVHQACSKAEALERTKDLLDEVGIQNSSQRVHAYPHELSGGQRQRVMIAMAIACKPELLIADEPTTALDVTIQKQILDLLASLQEKYKMSLLYITHDLAVIRQITDSLCIMYKGSLVESGTTNEIFKNPQHPYTKGLLNCRPQSESPTRRLATMNDFLTTSGSEKTFDRETLGKKSVYSAVEKQAYLELKGLSTYFPIKSSFLRRTVDWIKAVDQIDLTLYKGQILGLVGESGCGKTTLGRTILRLIEPSHGEIIFSGQDISTLQGESLRKLRKKIQIIFQDPYSSLNPRMTIGKALMEPMQVHKIGADNKDRQMLAEELMVKVGLDPLWLKRYPHEFSGGQRQRICIARALSVRPEFIICDESVSALDVSVQAQILNLLLDLKDEMDLTYIFISHDLAVTRFFADEIAVMYQGKIIEQGPAETLFHAPQKEYTKKLLAALPQH
jgi:peptide/nickel transport system ATP-binding protein